MLQKQAEAWPDWRSQKEKDHVYAQFDEARAVYRRFVSEAAAGTARTVSDAASPLAGIRVVSMALNVPGPLAVRGWRRRVRTSSRSNRPPAIRSQACRRSWYAELHRDVRVERVDLKRPEGRARMQVLLQDADVFLVSSQRPSALARLGLDSVIARHVRWVNIVGERARARGRRTRSHLSGARRSSWRIDAAEPRSPT